MFEKDLKGNLYKVWNRMSSGSYFPPPVRLVEIPKGNGGAPRMLGVPTVADRVAQTVVAEEMAKRVEVIFHDDSYGYRPGQSALDAVGMFGRRCWRADWVIDLDIRSSLTAFRWDLMLAGADQHGLAVGGLYVRRWLRAPVQSRTVRGVARPRHPARVVGLARCWPTCSCITRSTRGWRGSSRARFERYVDDAVVHCVSERQAS